MGGNNSMQRISRWLLTPVLVLSLGACSSLGNPFADDDDDPRQPAELVDFKDTVKIKKIWSAGVGDGQGKGLYKLTPAIQGDVIYAASAEGLVRAFDRSRGKSLWKEDMETPLSGGVGVYENALLLGSSEGFVLNVDAGSGEQLW